MQDGTKDSILERFSLYFLEDIVKNFPLEHRWALAETSIDLYNAVVKLDEFKYKMKLTAECVSNFP